MLLRGPFGFVRDDEPHELLAALEAERLEEHHVDDAEQRGVHADAHAER